jgi:hypothetical protein
LRMMIVYAGSRFPASAGGRVLHWSVGQSGA